MAVVTGTTTNSLLSSAGVLPDEFANQIALEGANQSVMMPLCTPWNVGRGNTEYLPRVGTRSVTARVRGTDDGNSITAAALNDSSRSFTKRTVYDALKWDYMLDSDLAPERLNAWLDAEGQQSAIAHANDFDAQVLGLYASASTNVGGAGVHASLSLIEDAIQGLRDGNARGEYNIVFPDTEWKYLARIPELTRFDIRGEGGTIVNGGEAFRIHGVNIYTTGNVTTASSISHGLAFAKSAVAYNLHEWIGVKEWDEQKDMSFYINTWSDYRYAYTFAAHLVDIQVAG